MQSRLSRHLLLTASLVVAAGCKDDAVRPCDLWTATAVISGRVTNSAGAPIVGALIQVHVAGPSPCDGPQSWSVAKEATTGANGDYSAEPGLGNSSGIRCVRVTEVASHTSAGGEVEFTGGCDDTRPPGQLTLDLVVP